MPRGRLPFSLSVAAVFALAAGLLVTVILFLGVRRLEHERAALDFQQQVINSAVAVKQQLDSEVQVLSALNQLFATLDPVSREQFRIFTHPLLTRHSYIQAFTFHRNITADERPVYEAQMRARYINFAIKEFKNAGLSPAQARDRYWVVDYIEPMQGNEATFGLNIASNARLMTEVQRAVDTGRVSSAKLDVPAQGGGKIHVLHVIMPVYRQGAALNDVGARRRAAVGDTTVVLDMGALIGKVLHAGHALRESGVGVSVYAGENLNEEQLTFRSGEITPTRPGGFLIPSWIFYDAPGNVTERFEVAGKSWRLVATAAPVAFVKHKGSLYSLIAGVVFSFCLAAYFQALSLRARRIQRLIEQRTMELERTNELLTKDIAARKRAEEALQLRQRAIEASANAVIITSATAPDYLIEYVNPAFERITGYSAEEVVGQSCGLLWGEDPEQPDIQEIIKAAREKREGHAIICNYGKGQRLFWSDIYLAPVRDDADRVNHFVIALYDITATKRYQAELEFQANRDTLTGLANRNLLRDRLSQASAYADRYGHPVWVLFLNLDRFKFVNDTLGQHAGDMLLKIIADRLQSAVRETDTVARLGADEFVLLLVERPHENLTAAVIQRIMDAVAQPITIEEYAFVMGCSVGVAVCPADGNDAEVLIKHASIAMYRAKETGRNNFQFYTSTMNERAMERLRIEGDLRKALERNEFVLHYQPQVEMNTGRIVGMEALIRWQHPTLGMVAPGRFIQLAEEIGLIVPIGAWVLKTACRQSVAWEHAGLGKIRVAVNLSARQFFQKDLVESIKAVLEETGLPAKFLELELTESMMMNDIEYAVDIMHRLKSIGVQLSIDDFGTGYSSLAYLKKFPIDLLKIDQSFVRDITADPDDAAIVMSIISLARSLRIKVIAEGVETESQLAYLQRHHCDQMQGYYFSRPVPAEECVQMLARSEPLLQLPGGSPVRTQTLLIIDDEANVVNALSRLLRQDGYQILTALTPNEAFEMLARYEVHVILCDQRMPLMNGAELLNRVKSLYPNTIRIMLSGYAGLEAVIDAINRGEIYRFFTKPWDDVVLRNNIREAFEHYWIWKSANKAKCATPPEAVHNVRAGEVEV